MNNKKDEVSLAKGPAKGYVLILVVDLKINGWERMGGRKKKMPVGNSSSHSGAAIPDDEKLAGAQEIGPTGHGSMNRWHWEKAETMATLVGCISRPEKTRCGARHGRLWRGLARARENGPRSHHPAQEMDGEKEEREAKLTERKKNTGRRRLGGDGQRGGADGALRRRLLRFCSPVNSRERELEWGKGRSGVALPF
jgi:hypothetical protein